MRESFARRVAVFLVLMLLIAVITSEGAPYRSAFAAVLDQVGFDDTDDSIVTTIVLTLEGARRNHGGGSSARLAGVSR